VILSVDPERALPVYEQVREQIKRMVASGTLRVGAQLPTIRQLATDLGLAKGTIERAYELLEADAVIETKGRKGTFVSAVARTTKHQQTNALNEAAELLVVVARQLGVDENAAVGAVHRMWQRL
jgi:DNA-binding transcriptional regulator YhcF (GntR family)